MIFEGKVVVTNESIELMAEILTYTDPDQYKNYTDTVNLLKYLSHMHEPDADYVPSDIYASFTEAERHDILSDIRFLCQNRLSSVPVSHFQYCPEAEVLKVQGNSDNLSKDIRFSVEVRKEQTEPVVYVGQLCLKMDEDRGIGIGFSKPMETEAEAFDDAVTMLAKALQKLTKAESDANDKMFRDLFYGSEN